MSCVVKRWVFDPEKLEYIHMNPVRAGLAEKTVDWPWSSSRQHLPGRSVGVPVKYIP